MVNGGLRQSADIGLMLVCNAIESERRIKGRRHEEYQRNRHRYDFGGLQWGAAGQTSDGCCRAPLIAKVYRWKMITTWPKNLPGLGTAPERLAQKLRVMSAGRLDIKVYGAGELVGALEVFDAVSQGTAQMGHGAAYYWRGKIPAAAFFATVPFGMNAQEMNGWLHYGGGMELWRELYAPFNLVPFAAGNSGVQMAGWFNKEINSVG